MHILKFSIFIVWICCFNYSSVQSQNTQNLHIQDPTSTLVAGTKRQTSTPPDTDSLPFGTRIVSSHHMDRNKFPQESKELPSHQKDQNVDLRNKSISKHNLRIGNHLHVHNSSSGAAASNSRRYKKIKAIKRRLRPTSIDSTSPQVLDVYRGHFSKSEQDQLMLHPKLYGGSKYDRIKDPQEERHGNKTVPNGRKNVSASRDLGSGNRDHFEDGQRTSPDVRTSFTVTGVTKPQDRDGLQERRVSRKESYKINTPIVSDYQITKEIDYQKEGKRNRTVTDRINYASLSYDNLIRNNSNFRIRNANTSLSPRSDSVTVSNDEIIKDIYNLQQKLKNNSASDDKSSVTVSEDDITIRNLVHQQKRPGNMLGLGETNSSTVQSNAMTWSRDHLQGMRRNYTGLDEQHIFGSSVAKSKGYPNERKGNKTGTFKRNNVVLENNITQNNTLLAVRNKDYTTNAFPNPVVDLNDGDDALPCPCYWSKEECGCNCTGSLGYDDFQMLAKSFRPCQNFSFGLSGGIYFSLPPNLFTRVGRVENIHFKVSNSTFDHLLDPTPDTSPFKGVIFGHRCLLELRNVSVRRGWNWSSLQNLKPSGAGLVDVEITGCGLKRLSSDFASVANGRVGNLRLAESGLEMVGSGAFATFDGLVRFRLPKNRLTSIRRSDLPVSPRDLKEIDLRGNLLQYLDRDLFAEMPSLRVISLAGNPLRMLGEQTFGLVIGKAHLLGLADFPLTCDCRMRWLKNSTLGHNSLFSENLQGIACRRPPHLRGTLFKTLSKEHLIC